MRKMLLVLLAGVSFFISTSINGMAAGQKHVYYTISRDDLENNEPEKTEPEYGTVPTGDRHNYWLPVTALTAGILLLKRSKKEIKVKGVK